MARTKQAPGFEIEVDGEPYVWRLHRRPQWSSDAAGWRGMAIAVRHQDGQRTMNRHDTDSGQCGINMYPVTPILTDQIIWPAGKSREIS